MDRCVGGSELKSLRISTAFSGILSKIQLRTALSDADLAYIRERIAVIRRDWRVTSDGERFFDLLSGVAKPGMLSEQQYTEMVRMCENFTNDFLRQFRAVARTQDDDD